MSDVEQHNRFAPPSAEVADVAAPAAEGVVLASRGRRLGGAVIDVAIILAVAWVVSRLTPWNLFATPGSSFTEFMPEKVLISFGLLLLVQGYPLFAHGQTWGKKMLGMRIVRSDGSPADFGRVIALRYGVPYLVGVMPLLAQLWGLADSLCIFRESRQCLHDSLADTIVIQL